ncbi:MAG: cytochrome c oxidase assembly protein [Actinobacteria bacterium]|nr:cytochrome c oxidase assembly protein [Actinomycetota bacterium]
MILAHAGEPLQPHDVWTAWQLDPVVVLGLAVLLWLHRRGRRPDDHRRDRAFVAAVIVVAAALVSPLEALSGSLASAHMVQHVLLIAVAAPLFAWSAPGPALLRGMPAAVRRAPGRLRRRLGIRPSSWHLPTSAAGVWLLHVVVLWTWHSAALYELAVEQPLLHVTEHVLFLGTAVLLWRVAIGRRTAVASYGASVLLVFATGMQAVLLSLLLTFANEAWYDVYADTTAAWGLTPLADQQLAGAIMWIPSGAIHVGIALALVAAWLRTADDAPARPPGRAPLIGGGP